MKKLLLLVCLTLFVTPFSLKAEDHDGDDRPKHHLNATETTAFGIGAAGLIGLVGYLVLRRRRTA